MEEKKKEMGLMLRPEVARGNYSNFALITHSDSEFIIDFATNLPGMPQPEVTSRILMTPQHAKSLLTALTDNVAKYEAKFGLISSDARQGGSGTFNLGDLPQFGGGKNGNGFNS